MLVTLSNIEKSYGIKLILSRISLTINPGDKLGIIGNNGAGKSTLFNIITGITGFDNGQRLLAKDLSIGYLEQSSNVDLSKRLYAHCLEVFSATLLIESQLREIEQKIAEDPHNQNLLAEYSELTDKYNQLEGYAVHSKTRGVLFGLGFSEEDFDRPLSTLSGGQRTRMDLARLLLSDYDLLLLDEPTNHLDIEAVKWLENYIANYRKACVIISHDRYFLDKTVTSVYEIEMTRGRMYHGSYSDYIQQKRLQYEHDLKAYNKNQTLIKKEEELIRRFKQTGTAKLAKRAKSRENKLERIDRIEKPLWLEKNMHLHFDIGIPSGHNVLSAADLSKSFEGQTIFSNLTFEVYKGDRIGLVGRNGIGKSTLFKILIGMLVSDTGTFTLGHHVDSGYYDQDHGNIRTEETPMSEIHDMMPLAKEEEVRNYLGSFLFSGDDVFNTIGNLSGGEKARLSLLKLMLSNHNFLMLDEPTNHLDIISRETLENALLQYEGTVFAISHDRYFLNRVCDKILEMSDDGITLYLGNYDAYVDKKQTMEQLSKGFDPQQLLSKTEKKQINKIARDEKAKERKARQQLEALEKEIHDKESRLSEIHDLQCLEENYSDPDKMKALNEESQALESALEKIYSEWEKML